MRKKEDTETRCINYKNQNVCATWDKSVKKILCVPQVLISWVTVDVEKKTRRLETKIHAWKELSWYKWEPSRLLNNKQDTIEERYLQKRKGTKLPGRAFKARWNTLIAASIDPLFACHVA